MSVVAEAAAAAALGPSSKRPPPVLCGARKRKDVQQEDEAAVAEAEEERSKGGCLPRHGLFVLETVEEGDEESLSIGVESDDGDEEEEGEEAESDERRRKKMGGGLGFFDALDEALPIKRGLSNYFSGKSRSFANLLDVAGTSAKDLAKPENPFNKRRRILRCSSIRRAASTSLTALPPFVPPDCGAANDATSGGDMS